MHGGAHISLGSTSLIFFSAGSCGPSNAPFGCIWVPYRAPMWAPLWGTHFSKNNLALQDSNLHFDVMNIKFYLLSQEGDTYVWWEGVGGMWWEGVGGMWWEGVGGMWWEGVGVGGHDVATTCSLQTHPHTLQGTPLILA